MKTISLIGTLIILLSLQLMSLQKLKISSQKLSASDIEQQEALTSAKLSFLKLTPVFGFRNFLADWTLLNFVQYFGASETRAIDGYSNSPDFFEIIVDRDPRFLGAYLYLTNTVSVYAGQPQTSIELMEKGLMAMSPDTPAKSYFVWRYKGTDEMLFIGDNQVAQDSFQTSADWANQSADKEAKLVARLSQQTADFLSTNPNRKPVLINGWMNVLSRAIDENIRQEAITQIESLGGEILAAQNGQVTVRYKDDE